MVAERAAVAGLWLAAFVAVDPAGFVATGPLRTAALSVAAALVVAAAGWRARTGGGAVAPWPSALWALLLVVLLAATLAGVDPLHRWIGTPDRRLGFVTWVAFGLLFVAGQQLVAVADRRAAGVAATAMAALAGLWALAEVAGASPLGASFAGGRAGGPFAQPAYLGASMTLALPLAAAAAAGARSAGRRWWWLGAAGAGLGLAALLTSQARSAVVAVVVAGGIVVLRRPWPPERRRAVLGAGAIAVVVLLAVAGVASGRVRSSLGRGGLGSRLDEWQVAVSVIADDPLLGLGPEGYRIGFARNVGAGYVRHHGLAFQPDRAHSAPLDVAAAGGLGAGAAYLGVLALVAAACWRAAASPDPWLAGLAAGVLGYGLQLLVLFPLSELDPLFWLSAGMVVGATAVTVRRARFLPVAGAAAAVTLPVLALLGGLEVVADRHLAAADLAAADRATELRPDSIRHWFVASRLALRGGTILDVDAALDRIEQGLERSPADPILRREHATLLTERALRGRLDADLAVAAATTARYLESAPNDPVLWRNQALVADASGEMAAARRAVAVAIELDPDDPVSQALAARL